MPVKFRVARETAGVGGWGDGGVKDPFVNQGTAVAAGPDCETTRLPLVSCEAVQPQTADGPTEAIKNQHERLHRSLT